MLGAVGAMCCFAFCTGLGLAARDRDRERLNALLAWQDALEAMRILLSMERLPMDDLIWQSAQSVAEKGTAGKVRAQLLATAENLAHAPSLTVAEAYAQACMQIRLPCEGQEERSALELLVGSLGNGTAEMRERAVASCLKRIALCSEKAREKAERSGKLYTELGVLGGLMLGIALW